MNAVANKYDALIRNSQNQIEQLRKEADRLRDEKIVESQKPRATP
jgi:hypothetical protein